MRHVIDSGEVFVMDAAQYAEFIRLGTIGWSSDYALKKVKALSLGPVNNVTDWDYQDFRAEAARLGSI